MASKLVNLGNSIGKSLQDCQPKGIDERLWDQEPPKPCEDERKNKSPQGWLDDVSTKTVGLGEAVRGDPQISGKIINNSPPNPNVVYRYSKAMRACDEAVMNMFKDIDVIDNDGKAHRVPIIYASQEKAVAAILQDNVRKDNSLVVDRIRLPMLAIWSHTYQMDPSRYIYHKAVDYLRRQDLGNKPGFTDSERHPRDTVFGVTRGLPINVGYTLYAWTMYIEDMMQMKEQIISRTFPMGYIYVRGVQFEIPVKLDGITSNLDVEPGEQNPRVVKFEFNFTAEAYIPQPIVRHKAVLKTQLNVFNSTVPGEVGEVYARGGSAVEGL